MAIPTYTNTNFFHETMASTVSDVQDILDRISVVLTSELPSADRWTEITAPGTTGRWRTPSSGGRTIDVELVRASAAELEIRVYDQNLTNIMASGSPAHREMDLTTTPATIKIWAGPHYLFVGNITDEEFVYGAMIDQTPMTAGASAIYAIGHANKNDTGTESENDVGYATMLDNGTGAHTNDHMVRANQATLINSLLGTDIALPKEIVSDPSGTNVFAGRLYQSITVDDAHGVGDRIEIPLGDGIQGTFEVVPVDALNGERWAIRVL